MKNVIPIERARHALTPRQQQIYDMIRERAASGAVSPTMREMADALGVSAVTVHEHVDRLCRKGLIRRRQHRHRGLILMDTIAQQLARRVLEKYADDEEATAMARVILDD